MKIIYKAFVVKDKMMSGEYTPIREKLIGYIDNIEAAWDAVINFSEREVDERIEKVEVFD